MPGTASLADLFAVDRTFLIAMARDTQSSKLGAIASRMGVDANYASQHRARLIDAGIIQPAGYGQVPFTVPYLRGYLQEHAATMGLEALRLNRPARGPFRSLSLF